MMVTTPAASRAVNLRILESETRSVIRGCCRMQPVALAKYTRLLESLDRFAGEIATECEQLEHQHGGGAP